MTDEDNQGSRACYLAGIAVTAREFGVPVRQLSLGGVNNVYEGAQLEPLGEWCNLDGELDYTKDNAIEEYLTVLLAGSVGKLIWQECRLPHFSRACAGASIEWQCFSETLECRAKETDTAFVIAFGYLKQVDGGDPTAVIFRLWQRAKKLLYGQPRREQVVCLARHLMKLQRMSAEEVSCFLQDIASK